MINRTSSSGIDTASAVKGTPKAILATILCQIVPTTDLTTFLLTYESFISTAQLFRLLQEVVPRAIPARVAVFAREFFYLAKWHPQPPARLARLVDIVSAKIDIKLLCLAAAASRVPTLRATPPTARSAKLDKMLGNEQHCEFVFDAFTPKDIAERLTFFEWELFQQLRPSELLRTAWQKEMRHRLAPNVVNLIEQFNRVVGWVATEIVCASSMAQRGKRLSAAIETMQQYASLALCRSPPVTMHLSTQLLSSFHYRSDPFAGDMMRFSWLRHHLITILSALNIHNYNAAMEIYSALNSAAVQRLKRIWAELPAEQRRVFDKTEALFAPNSNYSALMEHMRALPTTVPVMPYLGVYLKELALIDLGNPTWLDGEPRLLNFAKAQLMARCIMELLKRKLCPFVLLPNPQLDEQLLATKSKSDEELWELTESHRLSHRSSTSSLLAAPSPLLKTSSADLTQSSLSHSPLSTSSSHGSLRASPYPDFTAAASLEQPQFMPTSDSLPRSLSLNSNNR